MITNILFAVIFGVGIYILISSFTFSVDKKYFKQMERSRGMGSAPEEKPKTSDHSRDAVVNAFRRNGLAAALDQAELAISERAFLSFSALVLALGFIGGFLISGGILVSVAIAAAAEFLFFNWLMQRRETKRREYDDALAEMCNHMATGATIEGTIRGAIEYALDLAPVNVRADFELASSRLGTNLGVEEAFLPVRERRRSQVLDLMVDALDVWGGQRGTTVTLREVLAPLRKTIKELTSERSRLEAELSGVRTQAGILAIAPLGFVLYMRFTMVGFAEFYASTQGQVLQFAAYALSAGGYYLSERMVDKVRRIWEG